jgi:hypothetical protein
VRQRRAGGHDALTTGHEADGKRHILSGEDNEEILLAHGLFDCCDQAPFGHVPKAILFPVLSAEAFDKKGALRAALDKGNFDGLRHARTLS